jgi:hypothetical protein
LTLVLAMMTTHSMIRRRRRRRRLVTREMKGSLRRLTTMRM